MRKLSLVLLIVSLVMVGLFSQIAPAPAETAERYTTALLTEKRALLQQVIDRINKLITERERLVGQILILQELEGLEELKTEEVNIPE